ncbi:MAG TPA: helix-turn-helix transcriptional regulator [Streptosporangiaceae bacterium]|nr:helix-turn-helix transcriptional regulator [Streptosporangiaceae bacterium]
MESTGRRLARARRRRGLSQAALAGLVGRSESWLSQVERGRRGVDSHAVLTRLAAVLRVDVAEISATDSPSRAPAPFPYAAAIEQAMMGYPGIAASIGQQDIGPGPSVAHLREMARSAYRDYQATRYEATGRILPRLIRGVETASRVLGLAEPAVCETRALAYDTAAALLRRIGEPALAWTAADRAMAAAECSGQPLVAAVGAYRLSYVFTARRRPREALELAMTAAHALERIMRSPSPDQLSVYGGLHLAGATAAAADYDRPTVAALIAKAGAVAERLGADTNLMGTAFGPVNVAIHTISTSLRAGDARTAVDIGESLDTSAIPAGLVGRRTQVHIDLACAYALRRQDAAAVNVLLAAEHLSRQLVRYGERPREVLTELLRREHRPSTPQLRPLAHRVGVI